MVSHQNYHKPLLCISTLSVEPAFSFHAYHDGRQNGVRAGHLIAKNGETMHLCPDNHGLRFSHLLELFVRSEAKAHEFQAGF